MVPSNYLRRQTLKSVERFITPELKTFEDKALSAREKALAREKILYDHLLEKLMPDIPSLRASANAIAELDVLLNFAECAARNNWHCPHFQDEPGMTVTAGRHPVIEETAKQTFIPNDVTFHEQQRLLIITGPNMGGKSTYMRQTALIVLLCAIGSFVPAEKVNIGPIDRIFTRIGAADDLAGGRSTFMVEMTETPNIMHNATENSLVLIDEIGRGTSTFDGLSLAYACAQFLAQKVKAFTLFATHYFELTHLAAEYPTIHNMHLEAVLHDERIVFLHRVERGPASQSYGIQVAKLAGMPRALIEQAKRKLCELENCPSLSKKMHLPQQQALPFISDHPVLTKVKEANLDQLSAKAALDLLYQLKEMIEK
jgi:DNA mismatch repair protein MutS